jgi:preprotein translocase subunit SecG
VAALFPEHFQSFTMAFQFFFFNNFFGMHYLSYIQKHNQQQRDTSQETESTESFNRSDSLQAPRRTDPSSFFSDAKNFTQV